MEDNIADTLIDGKRLISMGNIYWMLRWRFTT